MRSLREEVAIEAMKILIANDGVPQDREAPLAVERADALLAELERTKPKANSVVPDKVSEAVCGYSFEGCKSVVVGTCTAAERELIESLLTRPYNSTRFNTAFDAALAERKAREAAQ